MRRKKTQRLWMYLGRAIILGSLVTAHTPVHAAEFAYSGDEGPGFWGELDPAWEACATDPRQSPINLTHSVRDRALDPLTLDLHPTSLNLLNNGHTITQTYAPGSTLSFEGTEYSLKQFHFHTLSEHALDGKRGVMELHAVFQNDTTQNLAVIGQLFKLGAENPFLATFDQTLPTEENATTINATLLNVADGFVNTRKYVTYAGSLTTPPCSPTVTWIVLKKWATMTEDQFKRFNDILGNNFRPLQDVNGRTLRSR